MRTIALTEETRKNVLENLLKRSPSSYGKFEDAVAEIVENVRNNKDAAVFEYTKRFDGADINAGNIKVTKEEIDEAYEENTGHLIVNEFKRMGKDVKAVPAVLCKNHGPFTWGKDAHEAVHNAVVLEEVAKMAYRAETINPRIQPAPQELQDKHYYRKHGANAYYGQK